MSVKKLRKWKHWACAEGILNRVGDRQEGWQKPNLCCHQTREKFISNALFAAIPRKQLRLPSPPLSAPVWKFLSGDQSGAPQSASFTSMFAERDLQDFTQVGKGCTVFQLSSRFFGNCACPCLVPSGSSLLIVFQQTDREASSLSRSLRWSTSRVIPHCTSSSNQSGLQGAIPNSGATLAGRPMARRKSSESQVLLDGHNKCSIASTHKAYSDAFRDKSWCFVLLVNSLSVGWV